MFMKTGIILSVVLLILGFSTAQAESKGDPKMGKPLAEKSCNACHISLMGGDGSKIYTRADRKVKSASQLEARVRACNANTGAGWFPEDEAHVAAYLNATYYHFK
jgi:mono/diheme cytochrome c family protein